MTLSIYLKYTAVKVTDELERLCIVAFASRLWKKTTKPQSGKVVSIPKPAPGTRNSQTLNTANQSTAPFSTAIIRINKQFQIIHHYFTYHKVRAH